MKKTFLESPEKFYAKLMNILTDKYHNWVKSYFRLNEFRNFVHLRKIYFWN